ncbi:hypothetical protein CTRI78_v011309 [Colletotrichum trifolii]|uniref:Uncharacterized protein n=1 Tax=Colletotrichum trifolii TaxID=5466 RepID=A0A4R8QCG4_COLTR|nr:hypothetical protein CTRI78_v011309 [Colletotrichum trifolii]
MPASHEHVCGIYSGHAACSIIGYDQHRWTAHFAIDTWFEECKDFRDKVPRHQQDFEAGMQFDPLSGGVADANMPIWNPRAYFFTVVTNRLQLIKDEWDLILQTLDAETQGFANRQNDMVAEIRHLSTPFRHDQQNEPVFEKLEAQLRDLKSILHELSSDLRETVGIGDYFLATDVYYFLNDDGHAGDRSDFV